MRKFDAEKSFTDQMFVNAEVSKLCSRSLFKYEQNVVDSCFDKKAVQGSIRNLLKMQT